MESGKDIPSVNKFDNNDTEAELMALKTLVARKKKEHLVMSKSNEDLERKVDQLVELVMSYTRPDEDRGTCNTKDHESLVPRFEEINQEKKNIIIRLQQERNMIREQEEENQQLKQKLDENMGNTCQGNEFEENRMIEQLLISNDDLSKECEELKKKLSETNGSLAILEEKMDNLRAAKLREIEKGNILASELALSEAKVLHLEQLARVEIRKMMSESSSHRSGSLRQNSSIGFECSSLRSGSLRQSASLELESVVAKTKQRFLGPTCVKEQDLIGELPPPLNTEKESHKTTELKINEDDLPSTFATEVHGRPLSPTVLIKEKEMFDFEDSQFFGEGKSSINFHEMDDEQLCQYQIKLLEARDNHNEKIDMNPKELEAEIEELNLYLSGEARKIPEAVPSRPCSVKFLSRGWGMTLTKAWAYFTGFHGVTGVKVVKDIVVVAFNTPEDAWDVIDKVPHVVTGCYLVPGPVTMLEDEDRVKESEGGANMFDKLSGEVVPASHRTVEFFMIGKVINEDLLKSIPGVESFSLDGKCVRLVFREKNKSEDMLNKGAVVVGDEKMTVGRPGQLGWAEVKVTGGSGVVDPQRLSYLLQSAGLAPLLDIQSRGGGMFWVVLENVKCRKLIKKGKLRLDSGFMLKVEGGEKQFDLDLGAGEELAGKMTISSEENFDTEGSSVLSQLKNTRKDINDNIVEDASDQVGRKNEVTAKDSLHMTIKCPGINDELKTNEVFNRSLGCSSSGTDDEDDCPQHIEHPPNNKIVVEVVKMSLTPKSVWNREEKPVEDEAGYRSLNWSSAGSLNDSVDAEDTRDEGVKSDKMMAKTPIKVVRIALAPSKKT